MGDEPRFARCELRELFGDPRRPARSEPVIRAAAIPPARAAGAVMRAGVARAGRRCPQTVMAGNASVCRPPRADPDPRASPATCGGQRRIDRGAIAAESALVPASFIGAGRTPPPFRQALSAAAGRRWSKRRRRAHGAAGAVQRNRPNRPTRIDVEAAADDHVLVAAHDVQEAVAVEAAQVAGGTSRRAPDSGHRLGRRQKSTGHALVCQRDLAPRRRAPRRPCAVAQHDAHVGRWAGRRSRSGRRRRRRRRPRARAGTARQRLHRLGHAVLLAQDGAEHPIARRISATGVGAVP